MVVNLACDVRWPGPHAIRAEFLGQTARLLGDLDRPGRLDRRAGRPGLLPDRRRRATITWNSSPPSASPPTPSPAGEAPARLQACLDVIEDRIRLDPANSNEYFFWGEDAIQTVVGAA